MARSQLNFRLSEEQRTRWEDHVEEISHYDRLSDLIKQAVRNQIERDTGETPVEPTETPVSGPTGGEVQEGVQDLLAGLSELQSDVQQALDAVYAQEWIEAELQTMVLENLPASEAEALTASEIAHTLDESPPRVRFALEITRQNTNIVEMQTPMEIVSDGEQTEAAEAGEPIWWRTD